MNHLSRPPGRREWIAAYTIAITGSILVAALTALLVDAGLAREANPATAWLADSSSWSIVLAFKFAVIVPAFAAYRYVADRWHPAIGRAGAWSFALVVSLNVLNDALVFFSRGPVFDLSPVLDLVPVALVGTIAAAVVATNRPLDTIRSAARDSRVGRVVGVLAIVALLVAAPPASVADFGAVGVTDAAAQYRYSWESGDMGNWNIIQATAYGKAKAVQENADDGSWSGMIAADTTGGQADSYTEIESKSTGVISDTQDFHISWYQTTSAGQNAHFFLSITDGTDYIRAEVNPGTTEGEGITTSLGTNDVPVDEFDTTGRWELYSVTNGGTTTVYLEKNDNIIAQTDISGSLDESNTYFRMQAAEWNAGYNTTVWVDNLTRVSEAEPLGGVVKDQNGEPCSNCTVEIVGVDSSKITADAGQTKAERAEELLEESSNPLPDSWDRDLQLTGSNGYFATADAEYVAIHSPDAWGLEHWSSGVNLKNPMLNPPAEEEVIVSVWNPDQEGLREQLDGVDRELPGATVNRDVVFEQIDPFGDVVTKKKYALDQRRSVGAPIAGSKKHAYARVSLPAGVYRVYAEGAKSTAYTIVVGDTRSLRESFATDLKDEANRLTAAAEEMQERLNNGKFTRQVVTTKADGSFATKIKSSTVEKVAISAYKIDGKTLTSMSNPTPQDMRAWVKNNDYNGSVYFTLEPRIVSLPASNVDITVRKFSSPPFPLLNDWVSKWDRFRSMLENGTRTELGSLYSVNLEDWNKTQLENAAKDTTSLVEQAAENAANDVIAAWEERTGHDWEEFKQELAESRRTEEELREDVRALEQTITSLRTELESGDGETTIGNSTVSFRQAFSGDFAEDAVVAVWKDHDGSTKTIPNEYVSVDKQAGRGDVVVISDYPIPNGSTGGFISVTVASEDGRIGRGGTSVENPAFEGEVPDLRSIDVSTLRPGPNERVSIEPHVETPGVTLEQVEVFDGQGNTVSASISNGVANFTPAETGTHFVRLTFNDSSGNQFVETMRVPVGSSSFDYPASVAVRKGRLGTYALAGDEVRDARVEIGASGQDVDVTALVEPDSGTSEVHVYMSNAPSTPKQSITTRVIEGDSIDTGTSLSRRVGLYLHGRTIDDGSTVYRKGSAVEGGRQPIPANAETRGGNRIAGDDGGTVLRTYTGKNGATTITVNADPGFGERIRWRIDVFVATTDLPLSTAAPVTVADPVPDVVRSVDVAGGFELVDELAGLLELDLDTASIGPSVSTTAGVVGVKAWTRVFNELRR